MTEEEIIISKIEEIAYIEIYDLFNKQISEQKTMLTIMVNYYDDKKRLKTITYCEADTYFQMLFDKVKQIYVNTKDKSKIELGNRETSQILNNEISYEISSLCKNYMDYESADHKIIDYQKYEMLKLKNIIYFCINQIYSFFGENIAFKDKIHGNRENFCIEGTVKGEDQLIPFIYGQEGNSFEIKMSNLLETKVRAIIKITFNLGAINIEWSIPAKNLLYTSIVYFNLKAFREEMLLDGKTIYHQNNDLSTCEASDKIKALNDTQKDFYYIRLPWNDIVAYSNTTKVLTTHRIVEETQVIFIDCGSIFFTKTQYQQKMLQTNNKNTICQLRIDGLSRDTDFIMIDNEESSLIVAQSQFNYVPISLGVYKSIEGRCFYQLYTLDKKEFDGTLKPIGFIDPRLIYHKHQLEEQGVQKLIGGKHNG